MARCACGEKYIEAKSMSKSIGSIGLAQRQRRFYRPYLLSVRARYRSRVKIKLVTMSRRTCDVRSSFTSRLRIVKSTFACLDDYAMPVTAARIIIGNRCTGVAKTRVARHDRVTERFR